VRDKILYNQNSHLSLIVAMNSYVLLIALVVALGGFVFGFDSGESSVSILLEFIVQCSHLTGIIATTLGHKTFAVYMYGPIAKNASLTGGFPRPGHKLHKLL